MSETKAYKNCTQNYPEKTSSNMFNCKHLDKIFINVPSNNGPEKSIQNTPQNPPKNRPKNRLKKLRENRPKNRD